ncbi:MAG TPA: hypothetical protein VF492_00610 [Verrucomicrobiae bacterium]|jgi:hypothetical protein
MKSRREFFKPAALLGALGAAGLPPGDEFWSAPAECWTAPKLWSGENLPADHYIKDVRQVDLPPLNRE